MRAAAPWVDTISRPTVWQPETNTMERYLCLVAFLIAALLLIVGLLDLAVGIPFGKQSMVFDIVTLVASGIICWQALEVWRQTA
jgi:hypothetical protein